MVRIFIRPSVRPNPFRGVQVSPYPSPDIQHLIPYPYPNTEIVFLWCRHPIVSYPTWLTLSVFESESDQKYENKYNISDIRSYPIRFHPYSFIQLSLIREYELSLSLLFFKGGEHLSTHCFNFFGHLSIFLYSLLLLHSSYLFWI